MSGKPKKESKKIGGSPFPTVEGPAGVQVLAALLVGAGIFGLGYLTGQESMRDREIEATAPAEGRETPKAKDDAGTFPVAEILDGNTVLVRRAGRIQRITLLNVLAPKYEERGGKEALAALRQLVEGAAVSLRFERPGVEIPNAQGFLSAYVFIDKTNVNVEMVRRGWSRFETKNGLGRYPYEFVQAEREAERRNSGMWEIFRKVPNLN